MAALHRLTWDLCYGYEGAEETARGQALNQKSPEDVRGMLSGLLTAESVYTESLLAEFQTRHDRQKWRNQRTSPQT